MTIIAPISSIAASAPLPYVSSFAAALAAPSTVLSNTVVNETTQINQDGTITRYTTYQDGSTKTTVEPNPNIPRQVGFLDQLNYGQLSVLLQAREFHL